MNSIAFTGTDVLMIIGYVAALVGGWFAMMRWAISRIDALRQDHDGEIEKANRNTAESRHKLANEIMAIRGEYLRREEFNGHLARIEKGVDGVSDDLKRLGGRLDRMLAMMAAGRRRLPSEEES